MMSCYAAALVYRNCRKDSKRPSSARRKAREPAFEPLTEVLVSCRHGTSLPRPLKVSAQDHPSSHLGGNSAPKTQLTLPKAVTRDSRYHFGGISKLLPEYDDKALK